MKLSRENVMSLEQYAEERSSFRRKAMEHKEVRRVSLTDNAILLFEDRLTMQYQLQEILRVERIFESQGIQEEIDVYNALIPDGSNWKATFMLEYTNVEERKQKLSQLIGVADGIYVRVEGFEPIYAIADEDIDRETPEKTSSVHFLRFELEPEAVAAVKAGAEIYAGSIHPELQTEALISPATRASLAEDLAA